MKKFFCDNICLKHLLKGIRRYKFNQQTLQVFRFIYDLKYSCEFIYLIQLSFVGFVSKLFSLRMAICCSIIFHEWICANCKSQVRLVSPNQLLSTAQSYFIGCRCSKYVSLGGSFTKEMEIELSTFLGFVGKTKGSFNFTDVSVWLSVCLQSVYTGNTINPKYFKDCIYILWFIPHMKRYCTQKMTLN